MDNTDILPKQRELLSIVYTMAEKITEFEYETARLELAPNMVDIKRLKVKMQEQRKLFESFYKIIDDLKYLIPDKK